VDRTGKRLGGAADAAFYENPRLSPDGKRLAVYTPENGGDIWIYDLERGAGARSRLTFDPGVDNVPIWSPDGSRIAFVSNRDGGIFNIYMKTASGTGEDELVLKTAKSKLLNDWSRDGQYLRYQEDSPSTRNDLWLLPISGERKPTRLLGSPFNEQYASFLRFPNRGASRS
jgi:Tol biopolymer transport system component